MPEKTQPVATDHTSLALAVQLRDAFTDGVPRGSTHVSLVGRRESFVVNPSGFHVVTDLPNDVTSLTVDVDPRGRYLPERRDVDLAALDPLSPVEEVDLFPSPAYRFPAGTTLVRGFVRDAGGEVLPDAELTVDGWPVETRTEENGEFALYFLGLTGDDVTDVDGERVVRIDGDNPTIEAHHDDAGDTTASVVVEEGTTTVADVEY